MPWTEKSIMEQRQEFLMLASVKGANVRELCLHFEISPTTGYKLLRRHQVDGSARLAAPSR